jgi:hypothetical protein
MPIFYIAGIILSLASVPFLDKRVRDSYFAFDIATDYPHYVFIIELFKIYIWVIVFLLLHVLQMISTIPFQLSKSWSLYLVGSYDVLWFLLMPFALPIVMCIMVISLAFQCIFAILTLGFGFIIPFPTV